MFEPLFNKILIPSYVTDLVAGSIGKNACYSMRQNEPDNTAEGLFLSLPNRLMVSTIS